MKRFSIIILCFVMLCTSLAGCKGQSGYVMSYKGADASEALYSYWMSTYKSTFLYYYNEGVDSEEFWDTLISDDKTYEEYVSEWIYDEMLHRTVAIKLFDDYDLALSDEKIAEIDADIEEKTEYAGSRQELNRTLAKFNMNIDMLRQVYIDNAKYDAVYDYLYGEGGKRAPSDKDRAEYFNNNYYCLKYITIYSGANLKTDEDGNYVYDEDGKIELQSLTEEEKKTKEELISTVVEGVENGGDFDEYIKEFSEVDYSDYPNGFFVCENDYSRFGVDIIDAAKELEAGEVRRISDENVTYIVKKEKLPAYTELDSDDKSQLEDMDSYITRELYKADFAEYIKDVSVNEEITDKYPIKEISENSYF